MHGSLRLLKGGFFVTKNLQGVATDWEPTFFILSIMPIFFKNNRFIGTYEYVYTQCRVFIIYGLDNFVGMRHSIALRNFRRR